MAVQGDGAEDSEDELSRKMRRFGDGWRGFNDAGTDVRHGGFCLFINTFHIVLPESFISDTRDAIEGVWGMAD